MAKMYRASQLRAAAEALTEHLGEHAVRVVVAGSIARGAEHSKDLDLVIEPVAVRATPSEIWSSGFMDRLEGWDRWRIVDRNGLPTKPTASSRLVICRSVKDPDFKMDLFLASRDRFGAVQVIRTGPGEFGKAMVTLAPKYGLAFREGALWRLDSAGGLLEMVPAPDERAVFDAMGLAWLEPAHREPERLYAADRNRHAAHRPPPRPSTRTQGCLFRMPA